MLSKSILIISSSFDKTVDYLITKFENDLKFFRINLDKINDYKISITNDNVFIENESKLINVYQDINSIYFRKIFLPELLEYDIEYRNYMHKEIYNFIIGLADSFEGKVLSRPSLLRKVENKVYQLHLAKKLNFLIPQSIISNDKDFVNKNIKLNDWIVKPLSIGKITKNKKIMTNIVNIKISDIEFSPSYFQKKIIKDYELRITFINNIFYCVKIISNKIDWRDDNNVSYELIEIPKIVKDECIKFLEYSGLNFGAFDYIVKDSKYYFLECNPNGQWLWLENKLELDISNKIMEYLNV
jgi:glutathione synthase/RimK-type ligase-like ATP-grasp enzyme